MKNLITIFILVCVTTALADKSKTIEKHYNVNPQQKIILNEFTGAKISVKSWNKNEVYVKLKIKVSSSDDDYETEYIKTADLKSEETESSLILKYEKTNKEGGGWSIFGIKFRINYYERQEILGEIFLPEKNAFQSDVRYGEIKIENLAGTIEIFGKSDKVNVKNCPNLKTIDNEYGNTNIENSGGNLGLDSKSSNVVINNFKGSLNINSDYSNVDVSEVTEKLSINSKSGTHKISKIHDDIYLNSDYSNMKINDIDGFADISTKSGSVDVKNVGGINVSADYSKINISGVSGKSKKDITVNSVSGSLFIEEAIGNMKIDNPYSDMDLRKIKGNIDLSGKSAKITGKDIQGNWNSSTEYVSIRISDMSAKSIKMTNKSNRIDLGLKIVPSEININNEYGDVQINMPKGFSGEIELTADYGSIETDFPVKVKKLGSSSHAFGKSGSGNGNIIIETKSGNIELKQEEKSQTNLISNQNINLQRNLFDNDIQMKAVSQSGSNITFSAAYQLGRNGEYYGASISKWLKTWNNKKVIVRGTAAYLIGNHWGEKSIVRNFSRVELGIDSRNTSILGRDFFNTINISYLYTVSDIEKDDTLNRLRENGWMFSVGFGTRWFSPAFLTAKYVWGPQSGIRLGIEFDF